MYMYVYIFWIHLCFNNITNTLHFLHLSGMMRFAYQLSTLKKEHTKMQKVSRK